MLIATTDADGTRHYKAPQALVDVAMTLFPGATVTDAVFRFARKFSWADAHSIERISVQVGHDEAVAFAKERLEKSATVARWPH